MFLSVINLSAVADRVNGDGVAFHREHNAPVTGPQPHSGDALERFHVANTRFPQTLLVFDQSARALQR
jgi:hypothetical protein